MTVFKTFLRVLNKCKIPIIMYTVILVVFGGLNMQTSENNTNFVSSKPDILIVNKDKDNLITNNLINYFNKNSNIINIEDDEEKRNDALFYRDVNYIIYIPKNYGSNFLKGLNPEIKIKSTEDYMASLAEMMLKGYLNVANIYQQNIKDEVKLIEKINSTLKNNTNVEVTSKLDVNKLSKTTFYYNFLSYSMIAGTIYVICLILSSFNDEKVKKRTVISSMNIKKYNRILLLSNCLFAFILWLIYIILGIILCGNIIFSKQGIIYILNSLEFTFCAVTIAFLIGNLVKNKNTINGIINVVALGSAFLCGAFVPVEFLPKFVLNIAHLLPSYWYIQTNELLKSIEIFNFSTLKPILINSIVIICFGILFIFLTNIITKKVKE